MGHMWRWAVVCACVGAVGCSKPAAQPPGQAAAPGAPMQAEDHSAAAAPTATEAAATEKGEIAWIYNYDEGMAKAKEENKPVMIDVFATWCGPCKLLDETVFSRAEVAEASKSFVTIRVDGDKDSGTRDKLGVSSYPTVLFTAPDGKVLGKSVGAVSYDVMLDAMAKAKEKFSES
jgi:thiol:disulfide interchange protein